MWQFTYMLTYMIYVDVCHISMHINYAYVAKYMQPICLWNISYMWKYLLLICNICFIYVNTHETCKYHVGKIHEKYMKHMWYIYVTCKFAYVTYVCCIYDSLYVSLFLLRSLGGSVNRRNVGLATGRLSKNAAPMPIFARNVGCERAARPTPVPKLCSAARNVK